MSDDVQVRRPAAGSAGVCIRAEDGTLVGWVDTRDVLCGEVFYIAQLWHNPSWDEPPRADTLKTCASIEEGRAWLLRRREEIAAVNVLAALRRT